MEIPAIRLLVATLADGSYGYESHTNRGIATQVLFHFSRDRKILRLQLLCRLYNIDLHEYSPQPAYRAFWFRRPENWPESRLFGKWLFSLSPEKQKEILDEIMV
jgi:hypothetical protein